MLFYRSALALVFAGSLLTLGCNQESGSTMSEAPENQTPPTVVEEPMVGEERMVSGELLNVDADANTFRITADDRSEHEFRYSAATEVSGESGFQALTGRAGARVTVHYRIEADGSNTAVRIEVLPDQPAH